METLIKRFIKRLKGYRKCPVCKEMKLHFYELSLFFRPYGYHIKMCCDDCYDKAGCRMVDRMKNDN